MSTQQLPLFEAWEDAPHLLAKSELIAGVDEVGRGALFGPVVAAAVILPPAGFAELIAAGLKDSKQLTSRQRQGLVSKILASATDCKIGLASAREIDRLNILQASLLAMQRAVSKLCPSPQLCLIDGNQAVPRLGIPQQTWIKGDQRSLAIAAASVVAKVWRDTLIIRLAEKYPGYALASNKGYGSTSHRAALQQLGPSAQHRRSFRPCAIASETVSSSASINF